MILERHSILAKIFFLIMSIIILINKSHGFNRIQRQRPTLQPQPAKKETNPIGGNFATKTLFSLTESISAVLSGATKSSSESEFRRRKREAGTLDMVRIANSIKLEYEAIFWATGSMDMSLWADNCTFADPFSSFGGVGSTKRFKTNADNLAKFIEKPKLKITSFAIADNNVTVGWIFSSKLKLPWKPVLAAAGETNHVIDVDNGVIVRYEERWKSNPWEVIRRLFVPST